MVFMMHWKSSPTTTLDNLGSLISALNDKNSSMKIYPCQPVLLPMCQNINAKIKIYDEQLTKWAETSTIYIIETVPTFRLGTAVLCCDLKDNLYSTLSRLGAMKLLGVIKTQCPECHLCNNWEQVKRTLNTHSVLRQDKRNKDPYSPASTRTASPNVNRPGLPALTTPTRQVDSRINYPGSSYAQNIPTYRAPSPSLTNSQRVPSYPRAAPTPNPSSTTRE